MFQAGQAGATQKTQFSMAQAAAVTTKIAAHIRRLRSLPEGPTVSLRRHCPRMPNLPAYLYLIRPRMCRPGLNVGILGHQLRFRLPWLGDWGLSHVSRD